MDEGSDELLRCTNCGISFAEGQYCKSCGSLLEEEGGHRTGSRIKTSLGGVKGTPVRTGKSPNPRFRGDLGSTVNFPGSTNNSAPTVYPQNPPSYPTPGQSGFMPNQPSYTPNPTNSKKQPSLLAIGIGAVAVIAILLIGIFGAGRSSRLQTNSPSPQLSASPPINSPAPYVPPTQAPTNPSNEEVETAAFAERRLIPGEISEDGTAYIPLYDGTSVVIHEEVEAAALTRSRKHIVVLLKDGTLYTTNKELTERRIIAQNCKELEPSLIRDEGFLYMDMDGSYYRILFADDSSTYIGDNIWLVLAQNTTSVLYRTNDGDIYKMANTSSEGTKVGTFRGHVRLDAISDDGQLAVWAIIKGGAQTIMLNERDSTTIFGDDLSPNTTFVAFSKDQKSFVAYNLSSEELWIKPVGSAPITVKLGAEPNPSAIYTVNGPLEKEESDDITDFFISTRGKPGKNVYHISMSGECEPILSNVKDYAVSDGLVYYIDEESALCCATLDGTAIGDETRIASDVVGFELKDNGKFLYFLKDQNIEVWGLGVADLYCYKVGEANPVKLSSDVVSDHSDGVHLPLVTFGIDGRTVFFFKDEERIGITYFNHGTLMKWSYGCDRPEIVATEVLLDSVSGEFASGEVDPEAFTYSKFVSVDQLEIEDDWMFFNGKESVRVVPDRIP